MTTDVHTERSMTHTAAIGRPYDDVVVRVSVTGASDTKQAATRAAAVVRRLFSGAPVVLADVDGVTVTLTIDPAPIADPEAWDRHD
jgi:hypothetical protein